MIATLGTSRTRHELCIVPLTLPAGEIARFIATVYDTYDHGKSFVPRWTGDFIKRVVFDHPEVTPDHALAAYVDDRLVGVVMAQPHELWIGQRRHKAACASWLAVSAEGARHFGAVQLVNAMRERLRARRVNIIVGVAYRSGRGVGLHFWERFASAFPAEAIIGPDLTFWARVLDGRALAKAVKDPLLKMAAHAAKLRPLGRAVADAGIRPYADRDFEACDAIAAAGPSGIRVAPSRWELACADATGCGPHTLVMTDATGNVAALSSYHILPTEDAGPLRIAMIELLNSRQGASGLGRLLTQTLSHAAGNGASLALIPRKAHLTSSLMLSAGFVPYQSNFKMAHLPLADSVPRQLPADFDLLVR